MAYSETEAIGKRKDGFKDDYRGRIIGLDDLLIKNNCWIYVSGCHKRNWY